MRSAGVDGAGAQERVVQHDHRLRRHLEGHAGHALLARVARGDRRLDRDGRRREGFDGLVAIGGCDKNMPGCVMAMARLDRPVGVRLRRHDPARCRSKPRHRLGVRGRRQHAAGQDRRRASCSEVERTRDPGPGLLRRHVHGEHHGVGDRSARHESRRTAPRRKPCRRRKPTTAGAPARRSSRCIKRGIKPSRHPDASEAFENAITTVIALGGSTNAVLHLLAIAHEAQRRARRSTTSRASASARRCSPICGRAAAT